MAALLVWLRTPVSILRRATGRDSVVAGWTNLLLSNTPKTM